jgi:transcriptional regulator GlxA family with amidase domain
MDLAHNLVEADLGRNISLTVARQLVLFVRRPGGQWQFSTLLELQTADRSPLRDLQYCAAEHLADDPSVEALAARVHVSVRNFSRVFRRAVGRALADFIERIRVEAGQGRGEERPGGAFRSSCRSAAAACSFPLVA